MLTDKLYPSQSHLAVMGFTVARRLNLVLDSLLQLLVTYLLLHCYFCWFLTIVKACHVIEKTVGKQTWSQLFICHFRTEHRYSFRFELRELDLSGLESTAIQSRRAFSFLS